MKFSVKSPAIFVVLFFSNLFKLLGLRACRFYPTCSKYSLQAFDQHHFFRAVWLTLKRLLKCHPFVSGGYDPLPDAIEKV